MTGDFVATVKIVRTQLNLSQEDFAHALGVSFATINRWENGKVSPSRLGRKQFDQFFNEKLQEGLLEVKGDGNGKS